MTRACILMASLLPIACAADQSQADRGPPAKLVYLGRRAVTIEVPFTLRDVPLP